MNRIVSSESQTTPSPEELRRKEVRDRAQQIANLLRQTPPQDRGDYDLPHYDIASSEIIQTAQFVGVAVVRQSCDSTVNPEANRGEEVELRVLGTTDDGIMIDFAYSGD